MAKKLVVSVILVAVLILVGCTALLLAVPVASVQTEAQCRGVDFSPWVGDPYGLIAVLDAQSAKVPQPSSNFTLNADEDVLYWTGAYTGGRWPTGFAPLLVDGQTGVFCIPKDTTVTINSVGAYMPLAKFDASATPNTVDDEPEGAACMPVATMASLLNELGRSNPEGFFRSLDSSTNVEGAEFLAARWRPEPLGPKAYTDLVSGANVYWLQEGRVGGIEGTDYVLLVASEGKWAVLNLNTSLDLRYAHTGVRLCEGLDLAGLVDWWGK